MSNPALELRNVTRTYRSGETDLQILRGINLTLQPGEITALVAPSGTGKSTLLHLAGLLERPTTGQVLIAGQDAGTLDDPARTAIRRDQIGFVYQFHHLLGEFTALENVMLPLMIANTPRPQAAERARTLLASFGLAARASHLPGKLSGGEQQRVAIARAIAKRPDILLCDEPTGALDFRTGKIVLSALEQINRELGTTIAVITHNAAIAAMAHRVVHLSSGRIVKIDVNTTRLSAQDMVW